MAAASSSFNPAWRVDGPEGDVEEQQFVFLEPQPQRRVRSLGGRITRANVLGAVGFVCLLGVAVHIRPSRRSLSDGGAIKNAVELEALPVRVAPVRSLLKPAEDLHDGNTCDANEEELGGLCYKKCNLLTLGQAPIRTSAWTCCEGHPCTLTNQRGRFGTSLLCNGFDVDGNGNCPHKPGACLLDEELHLGMCYKKCSLLTDGKFPNRVAAATCCKVSGLGCLDILNDKTRHRFDVGGGKGDHDPTTPNDPHPPEKQLTEVGDVPIIRVESTSAPQAVALPEANFRPSENMHDGNVCDDSEEFYGGLCYKRCSLLTNGEAAIRTSSWTCCKAQPCGLWNQRGSIGHKLFCNGYDVSGDGSCPHKPGACLANEELHFGVCYQKCSLLTDGAYPYRFAAATCCKVQGLSCIDPRNSETSDSFDVGGAADENDATKLSRGHLPHARLTEDGAGVQLPTVVPLLPHHLSRGIRKPPTVAAEHATASTTPQAVPASSTVAPSAPAPSPHWGAAVPGPNAKQAQASHGLAKTLWGSEEQAAQPARVALGRQQAAAEPTATQKAAAGPPAVQKTPKAPDASPMAVAARLPTTEGEGQRTARQAQADIAAVIKAMK